MKQGRFIAVVGPSGVGKDSVMAGLAAADPALHLVRRTITRTPELGGEDYDSVSVAKFNEMAKAGHFAIHWGAHELQYAIPAHVRMVLAEGETALQIFHALRCLQVTRVLRVSVSSTLRRSPRRLRRVWSHVAVKTRPKSKDGWHKQPNRCPTG